MVRELRVESFYTRLRDAASAASSTPLLIFPSASDADSLCALKIVTHVLASDSLRYSVYPVSSFNDIEKFIGPGLRSEHSLTLLLINWGCHRDLRRLLNLGAETRVFVIDSHRPIHLHNLSEQNDQVVVLYTLDDEQQADLAYDFDVSALASGADLNSDDEIDDTVDSDEDSESENEDGARKRRRVEDESDDPVKLFGKLKREYYRLGTFHGRPSGCLMFELAHSLRKNTNELLWLACLSLTDQFVHERLTNEWYQASVMELEQHINSSGNLDAVTSVTLKDGTKIQAPESSRIACEDEPHLMLLREWNLFDSMLCFSYIATKLKTWSDKGLKKLKLLLARMGFPLVDCQKKFQYMSMDVKLKMKNEFERCPPPAVPLQLSDDNHAHHLLDQSPPTLFPYVIAAVHTLNWPLILNLKFPQSAASHGLPHSIECFDILIGIFTSTHIHAIVRYLLNGMLIEPGLLGTPAAVGCRFRKRSAFDSFSVASEPFSEPSDAGRAVVSMRA